MMNYSQAIGYLDKFINYEKIPLHDYKTSLKLERMHILLGLLNDPHAGLRVIHAAGTKGKGSTVAMISSILNKAGFRTGMYTSPHFRSFCERIKINGEDISSEEVGFFVGKVKDAVDASGKTDYTFFELYTAAALLYFKEKRIDFAVLETGLGGRLDATNVADSLVSVITPISIEHTRQLGSTIEEISREKAAIVKKNSICVSAPQEREARDIIEAECKAKNTRLYEVGRHIFYESLGLQDENEIFSVSGIFTEHTHLRTSLLGGHQLINAATAIGAIDALRFYNVVIPEAAVKEGISDVRWPGRLEIIGREPLIVLDGAQNKASANVLKNAVKRIFRFNKLILILGISSDKDIPGICGELEGLAGEVILTKADIGRAADPDDIKKYIHKNTHTTYNIKDALELSERLCEKGDLVLITGSLFVVGEARDRLIADGKLQTVR